LRRFRSSKLLLMHAPYKDLQPHQN
jgi:hypothetical protein